jgi:hypothetical protein
MAPPRSRHTKESTLRSELSTTFGRVTDSLVSELMDLETAIQKWAEAQFQSEEDFMSSIAEIKQQYELFFKVRFYFVSSTCL